MPTSSPGAQGQCPHCSTLNTYTSLACSECGARLPWADAVDPALHPKPVVTPAGTASGIKPGVGLLPSILGVSTGRNPDAQVAPIAQTVAPPSQWSAPSAVSVPVPAPIPGPVLGNAFICPVCHSQQVQKVSAIRNSGITHSTGTHASATLGHVWGGPNYTAVNGGSSQQRSETQLAQMLAPPPPPKAETGPAQAVTVIAIILFIAVAQGGAIGAWFLFSVAGVLAAILWHQSNVAHQARLRVFQLVMEKWDCLFYCHRCDHVYNAQNSQVTPAQYMRSLL